MRILAGLSLRATLARTFCSEIGSALVPPTAFKVSSPAIFSRAEPAFFFSRSTELVFKIVIISFSASTSPPSFGIAAIA